MKKTYQPTFKLMALCSAMSLCLASFAEAATYEQRVVVKELVVVEPSANSPATPLNAKASPSSTTLSFGEVYLGLSLVKSVLLTNTGTAPLRFVAAPGVSGNSEYTAQTDCADTVTAGQFCTTNVTFSPNGLGVATGSLGLQSDAQSGGDTSVALTGTGVSWVPLLALNPAAFNFGQVVKGSQGTAEVILSNTGTMPVPISVGSPTGGFSAQSNCGTTLESKGSCTVTATFTPTSSNGQVTGYGLPVTWGLGNEVVSVPATGDSVIGTTSVSSLEFGDVVVDSTRSKTFLLSNTGTAPLTMGVPMASASYTVSGDTACGQPIPVGQSCTLTVTYAPVALGAKQGTVTVPTNMGDLPVTLTGTGTSALGLLQISPAASIAFGSVESGTSATSTITLTNTGPSARVLKVGTPSTPFSVASTTCGTSLGVNASCDVVVSFLADTQAYTSGFSLPIQWGTAKENANVALAGSGGDPYFNKVVFLDHFDGLNGGTAFEAYPSQTLTPHSVTTSTTKAKFGTASMYLGQSTSYLQSNAVVNPAGVFTAEAFVYPTALNAYNEIFAAVTPAGGGEWAFGYTSTGLFFYYGVRGVSQGLLFTTATISTNAWHHMAVVRDSAGAWRFYLDGVLTPISANSGFQAGMTFSSAKPLGIGGLPGFAGYSISGYIDEARITNGVARYSGNSFTVPSMAFPNQ
jgi:hypothetical protein